MRKVGTTKQQQQQQQRSYLLQSSQGLSSPPRYHVWVLSCDFLHLQISSFIFTHQTMDHSDDGRTNFFNSQNAENEPPMKLLTKIWILISSPTWALPSIAGNPKINKIAKEKNKHQEHTYQACKWQTADKKVAGFLIISNFLQSFGSRFPAVRFPGNRCGCSSVAILYTSTKRNTCTYRLARPLLLLQKDFPKLNWFPNTKEVTPPRKQSQRKRTGVHEQYLQYQTQQFRQMHPMRKLLLSTFEEWFCFSPYSASARVLVFPLSCPFSLCRSVPLFSAKQNLHPPYNATTTKQKTKTEIKTTITTALSISPTLPFAQEKTHQKSNYI